MLQKVTGKRGCQVQCIKVLWEEESAGEDKLKKRSQC